MENREQALIKHPPTLSVYFATEMWERYGFYVVQSLLALYLALHFKWDDQRVYALVGTFTALTYLSPVIGGWIADHLIGQKRAILLGALLLFLSYLALTISNSNYGLAAALAGIAVGTGLLKPNISSLLGNEYPVGSPKRERGFTIFYMGLTAGILLGTTLPSVLNEHFGWSITFSSAAFGAILSFAVFAYGAHHFKIVDYHPFDLEWSKLTQAIGMMLILWFVSFFILKYPIFANSAFGLVVLMSLFYVISTIKNEDPEQAKLTLTIVLLCLISVLFWTFYFQMFMSLTLFIARAVEPTFLGINFPPPYYVSVQSLGMILFGLMLTRSKKHYSTAQSGIRTGNKFLLSMIFMTMAYTLITLVCNYSTGTALLSPWYFLPAYLFISISELLLSPVGLSAITVLASRKKVSTMMGIFFVSLGIGAFLSGKLATITAIDPSNLSVLEIKAHYAHGFSRLLTILMGSTLVCFVLNFFIRQKLMRHESMVNK